MKVKFKVTNSSSTSFIIWGIEIDNVKFKNKYKDVLYKHYIEFCKLSNEKPIEIKEWKISDYDLYLPFENSNLQFYFDMKFSNNIYIGKNPFLMKSNETLIDFKKSIISELCTLGFNDININSITSQEIEQD